MWMLSNLEGWQMRYKYFYSLGCYTFLIAGTKAVLADGSHFFSIFVDNYIYFTGQRTEVNRLSLQNFPIPAICTDISAILIMRI